MLKRIALGTVLLAGLLTGTAWADDGMANAMIDAVHSRIKARVEALIAQGANVNAKAAGGLSDGETPLYAAAMYGSKDIVEFLIAHGADVDARIPGEFDPKYILSGMSAGETPLFVATNKDVAELLIAKGADVNARSKRSKTPLFGAVNNVNASPGDSKDLVEFLIAHGADVNARDYYGFTPLASARSKEVVESLIAHGSDVNAQSNDGRTPLHGMEKKEVAEVLIAHGADVNAKDKSGAAPLYYAIMGGHPEVAEALLSHGANINAQNNEGETALFLLGSKNFYHGFSKDVKQQLVAVLLNHGADVNAKDKAGQTPLSRVTATADQDLIQALQAHGGKTNVGPRVLFQQSLAQFKDHSDNETLRISIIDLALKLKPAPAILPEAEAAAGRAAYIFKNAKSDDDTLNAAKEYLKAIEAAPWVANYYYNLCTVLEKTPYTQQALHACKLYSTAAPNAPDAADMQQRIAGLQYAVDKNKEQMKQRADHYNINGMYRMGGLSGQVSGKDVGLKLTVDWQAAPPKYQVMGECDQGGTNGIWTGVRDLVSADTTMTLCSINMHLVIKADGAGFVELGDAGTGSIRTTLDELFKLRRKALEESEVFSRDGKTYVAALQGGLNKQVAGYAMYESDCTGNPLRQDARALPDDFVTLEMKESGKSPYSSYGSSCASQFASKTGYSFGGNE